MNSNQRELFEEFPASVNPPSDFAQFRVGEKIIQVPCSFWKDGRIRADLSKFGAGEVVSRNGTNLQERIIQALRDSLGTIVEAVRHEFARARTRTPTRPRLSNKRALEEETTIAPKHYINPFAQDIWKFSKAPQWLLVRREPSLAEKLVYTRLTYSPNEKEKEKICEKKDKALGLIDGLDQTKLASELGVRRECVCGALKSLRKRGLIEYVGRQGAKGWIKFLWHPWMSETCALNAQVSGGQGVRSTHRTCATGAHQHERFSHDSCAEKQQVSPGSENREKLRKVRKNFSSPIW